MILVWLYSVFSTYNDYFLINITLLLILCVLIAIYINYYLSN